MKIIGCLSFLIILTTFVSVQAAARKTTQKFAGTLRADESSKTVDAGGKTARALKEEESKARAHITQISIRFAESSTGNWTTYKPKTFKPTDKVTDIQKWIVGLTGAKNITLEAWTTNEKSVTANETRIQPIDMHATVADIECCDGDQGGRWIVYSKVSSKVSAAQKAATAQAVTQRLAKGSNGSSPQTSPLSTARRKSDAASTVVAANKAGQKSPQAAPAVAAAAAAAQAS